MLASITSAITVVLGWIGTTVTALVGEAGELKELMPLLAVGCAISAIMLGVKVIKGFIWGA